MSNKSDTTHHHVRPVTSYLLERLSSKVDGRVVELPTMITRVSTELVSDRLFPSETSSAKRCVDNVGRALRRRGGESDRMQLINVLR